MPYLDIMLCLYHITKHAMNVYGLFSPKKNKLMDEIKPGLENSGLGKVIFRWLGVFFRSENIFLKYCPNGVFMQCYKISSVSCSFSFFPRVTQMASSLRGIFVPIPTFFKENEDLDLDSLDLHVQYLSKSGIAGIVVLGSMGEAVSLSDEERDQVIKQVVTSVKKYNPSLVIIAGTSSQSARNAISYTRQAAAAGAHYCLILPPSFYRGSITDDALVAFYTAVADQSPLPIIIYNYPGVCQGIDISTKVLVQLSKHKSIVGLKGTDANVGKMADLVQKTDPKGEPKKKRNSWFEY